MRWNGNYFLTKRYSLSLLLRLGLKEDFCYYFVFVFANEEKTSFNEKIMCFSSHRAFQVCFHHLLLNIDFLMYKPKTINAYLTVSFGELNEIIYVSLYDTKLLFSQHFTLSISFKECPIYAQFEFKIRWRVSIRNRYKFSRYALINAKVTELYRTMVTSLICKVHITK